MPEERFALMKTPPERRPEDIRIDGLDMDQCRELVSRMLGRLVYLNPIKPGVVIDNSAGVYREPELLRRLHDVLVGLSALSAAEFEPEVAEVEDSWEEGLIQPEEADDLMDRLEDAINDQLLDVPYLHFGTHDHEPEVWGFWPALDSLEEDSSIQGGGVIKTGELPSLIAHVNDHGNLTLYRVYLEEVWAVV